MSDTSNSHITLQCAINSLNDTPFMKNLFKCNKQFIHPSECNILNEIVSIPINLEIIRNTKNYKKIIMKICESEVVSYYIKYSNFDNANYFHNITKFIIYKNALTQILKTIWCPFMFSKLQSKFKAYNYKKGNLGYNRINNNLIRPPNNTNYNSTIHNIYRNIINTLSFCYYCKLNNQYSDLYDYENFQDEWSD